MPTHDDPLNGKDRQPGYETSDANIRGVVAFIIALGASMAVFLVLCFGMGKLINEGLIKHDGPLNHWNQEAGVQRANMVSDPAMEQQQLHALVSKFPEPRLLTDNGDMDVAQMHAREDLLLNHYTWVDEKAQTVRIPITLAMQILASKGLPVEAPQGPQEQPMFGDANIAVTAPLTDGFARTGPELRMIEEREQRVKLGYGDNNKQARLGTAH